MFFLGNNRGRKLFRNFFKPSIYIRTFKEVDLYSLKAQGIKVFVCDLDNTLVPHYKKLPTKEVLDFIRRVEQHDMKFVLMSNNSTNRVRTFANKAGVTDYYANAKKPLKTAMLKVIRKYNVKPHEVVIMGDQLISDILVANRVKTESILVQPLVSLDSEMTTFNLFLEKFVYAKLEKQNILKKGSYWSGNIRVSYDLL